MSRNGTRTHPKIDPLLRRAREETSLIGFVNVLLRHRLLIVVCALIATGIALAGSVRETRAYSTSVEFTPRGASSSLLAGIAAQYNLSIVGADPSQSIEFYEGLIRSNELLRRVAARDYQVRVNGQLVRGTLPTFYKIRAGTRDAEIDLAAVELSRHISASSTHRTGIVTFYVSAPYADLAQQIGNNIVSELDVYNTERRRSQVTQERVFIGKRVDESRIALSQAENDLRGFLDVNREYHSSPGLTLEYDRLQREVARRSEIYTSLSQAEERARIEEVRDTPAITVVQPAILPMTPDIGSGVRNTLLGAIAGMLIGIVLAFVRERIHETEIEQSPAYEAFTDLKRETMRDLSRPLAPVGKLFKTH
ncbi:MAG: hypothetical protein ABR582_13945 [Gemmatimonadaceae bacterium]